MSFVEVLLPVFAQVILTFVVAYILAYQRITAIRSGQVHPSKIALREPNWPLDASKTSNNLLSQFEIPVLFYVLMILLLITRKADIILMTLAWIFVALRIVHAYVHLTSNRVSLRGPLFILGVIVLTIMWGLFMVDMIRVV
jgi:hypothetical protein